MPSLDWIGLYKCNEECRAAKGKQTWSCFEAQIKFVNFLILAAKSVTTNSISSGF
jgi:hypothetical protein